MPYGFDFHPGFSRAAEEINLVFINWEKLAAPPYYPDAVDNVKIVGRLTGKLIEFLVERGVAPIEDISFVGHSLGAHIGNYVARHLNNMILPRIYGEHDYKARFPRENN